MEPVDRFPRRLAAILYADVAGYSRLTGEDEDDTHRRLSDCLDLISSTVERHGGRVMHYAGDAVLAMFDAAVDALSCAALIQRDLQARNESFPDDRKVQFRIGINIGDVIEDRGDIYGDGVNVAARLESLAEPGGICISELVRSAVGNKLPLEYRFVGEKHVKNIVEPVRAFRVAPDTLNNVSIAAIAAAPQKPEATMPNGLAVLPFANLSGDSEQEYFSDGISEDLIFALSSLRWIPVIARSSSFAYKGRPVDVKQVGTELGVQYILEGSVRKSGNRVRIHAQLADASGGHHLWAERYERELDDIFEIQDDISTRIVAAIEPHIDAAEMERTKARAVGNMDAYQLVQRGLWHFYRSTPEDNAEARRCFSRAIELAPGYSQAFAALALNDYLAAQFGWSGDRVQGIQDAKKLAKKAVALDDKNPRAYFVVGNVCIWLGEHDEGLAALDRATQLCPSFANAYSAYGYGLDFTGRFLDAAQSFNRSFALRPNDPSRFRCLPGLALSHYQTKDFERAELVARESVDIKPDYWPANQMLAASLGQLGRVEEAREVVARIRATDPDVTATEFANRLPYRNAEYAERVVKGLHKAGMTD